jgi:signal peptidase II
MVRRATRLLLLVLLLGMVGCDHATKISAKAALEGHAPLTLVTGLLDLRYAENRDTAFSLSHAVHLANKESLLAALATLGLAGIAAGWWRRRKGSLPEQAGFALIVAGAIGNIVDRIARGYVVDFIHVAHWPVFNVADAAICVGAGLIVLARRVGGRRVAA